MSSLGLPRAEQKPTSLVSRAYDAIKHRIFTVVYAPGAYLNEVAVSRELEIGRTPVHHALHRLAKEGLVDVIPRKGIIVRPVSLDEVANIIEARLVNEAYCASLAARRVTRADLEEPKLILGKAQSAIDAGEGVEELMQLDQSFHRWMAKISGNPVLAEFLSNLQDRAARFWFLSLSDGHHSQQVQHEHFDLLQAIASKDEAQAADKARAHIDSFRNTILRVL
ncbi:GntR family transcriptional regulator [Tardiphaga sp.]|jgi:DNA-binding GntR family transcriptional regulator|uniref:GntR family transcriptional regulator n=1 Tax=Tardiphaga sp. TaxID=1926292 RepID=UPI0037DA51E9